ncbi:ABC transporter substrate-binding protein [Pseudodesulfovibrio sp. JC047]|uniref:ABC transporter substrate-binding protein n=1 Tax=Pseudodesulfovibrio sp. JC047 TaxID=2683199 RepID=UPI0013D1811B|nr:ABC transporter substrate-binding protein [Pseudodesulfovibrio sp. JC047]NDV20805.1 ABC transporter substrate-binding protein [Pseudodesulfovibrio sp. JC047]
MPASTARADDDTVIFADLGWDSIQVHNRIAGFIIEHGYGKDVEYIPSATAIGFEAIMRGDMDINMESWTQSSQELYDKGIKNGTLIDLGPNYSDGRQGIMVPTYMIKGDSERGIKPITPNLKSVSDLAQYAKVFADPEDPSMGRIYTGVSGWTLTEKTEQKVLGYGLDEQYNMFAPGSDAALAGSMLAAYKRGKPWLGYYWGPTWILGSLDMTFLSESPYDAEIWKKTKTCAYPPTDVNILVSTVLPQKAPAVVEMLKKYTTTMDLTNQCLAYIKKEKADLEETAQWFLKNHEAVWTQWVPTDVATKVKAELK